MKGYENDIIVNNLVAQINGIKEGILKNYTERELIDPKTVVRVKRTIIEAQQPLYDALADYIATHPAPIEMIIPDEMDNVSEESKEKTKEILNKKKYFEQILKFKSTPKKTDFFDALMLSPNYNQTIKDILDKIEKEA